jgi:hypothetical protein
VRNFINVKNRPESERLIAGDVAGSCRAGALDFGIRGVRAAVVVRSQPLVLDLVEEGSSPASLLTLKNNNGVPNFPNLLDRLGEDCLVSFDNRTPQKPHLHLRDLFHEVSASLNGWLNALGSLYIVVSAYATDLQRALILRAANSAQWPNVNLVNKTTALAIHGLQQRPAGTYLALVLGHGPAEASVVEWQDGKLRTLSYCSETRLGGDEVDRCLLQRALRSLTSSGSQPARGFGYEDWMWMRNRAELVRRRLNWHHSVTLEIPSSLTGRASHEVLFDRGSCAEDIESTLTLLSELIPRCCREADVAGDDLKGFLVTGGLLMHVPIFHRLSDLCQDRLSTFGVGAQLAGACEFASQEPSLDAERPSAPPRPFTLPPRHSLYIAADVPPSHSTLETHPSPPTPVIEPSKIKAASAEHEPTDQRAGTSPALVPPQGSTGTYSDDRGDPLRQVGLHKPASDYPLAKKHLRMAEASLRASRPEEAVRLSHKAWQTSSDSRIFRAMIKIHLRVASQHPPSPGTFVDDRRWLLCALNDDGTNYEVQKAVMNRFMTHIKQLIAIGTEGARADAAASLDELLGYLPTADEAQELLRQFRSSGPSL